MRSISGLRVLAAFAVLALASGACSPSVSPGPTILPGPSGGGTLSPAELRLLLVDRLGPRWYCDPDEFPVAHGSEQERAVEAWPEVEAENELMRAIAARLSIDVDQPVTDAQKLAIYRQWKVAVSIPLDVIDTSHFRFDYAAQPVGGAQQGVRTAGTIDDRGNLTVEQQGLADAPNCPICLSLGTRIDTPDGPLAVERLRLGDPIWTLDRDGRRIAGTVIALGSTRAPTGHHVVRLVLEDGRSVTASPGHPLADGRHIGEIRVGDVVDASRVVTAELVAYTASETFDIVVSGPTGLYLAGGIPLDSTLR
jgi:Hint domain